MIRKRNKYDRARDQRRRRPKHPAPLDGFLLHDVSRLTAVPIRTLRDYIQRGLLRYSERRGTLTRYPRSEVIRLLGAIRLKTQTKATWAAIKRQVDTFKSPDLEKWLLEQKLNPQVAAELGMAPLASTSTPLLATTNPPSTEHSAGVWQRTELLPGLELHVSAAASAAVKAAARRIIEEHVGG
jgi:DNA-binding transcriptional MerR regulator